MDGEDLLAEVVVGLRQEEEAPQEGLVDGAAVDEAVDSVDVEEEEAVVEEGAEEEALVVVEEEAIEVHKSWSQCLDLCGYHFHPLASVLLHRYRLFFVAQLFSCKICKTKERTCASSSAKAVFFRTDSVSSSVSNSGSSSSMSMASPSNASCLSLSIACCCSSSCETVSRISSGTVRLFSAIRLCH